MTHKHIHIPDRDLIAAASGELETRRAAEVRDHVSACWTCRARSQQIEAAIAGFVRAHHDAANLVLPDAAGPRALFRARLAQAAAEPEPAGWFSRRRLAFAGPALAVATALLYFVPLPPETERELRLTPDPRLTPGATVMVSAADVCAKETPAPRVIPASVGRQVFDRYGIRRPRAMAYELDYLIDPALGGADDPRNFWPQPYAAPVWNAHVKDALEDHLHQLVCRQQLSLEEAQQEIAADWISAYKKYFQTDQPIASHVAFLKDRPWQP
jgi:hypothetical protein